MNIKILQKLVYFALNNNLNFDEIKLKKIEEEYNSLEQINEVFQKNFIRKDGVERVDSYNDLFEKNREIIFDYCEKLGLIQEHSSIDKFDLMLILGAARHSMEEESKYFDKIKDKNFNKDAKIFLLGGEQIFKEETESEIEIMYNFFKKYNGYNNIEIIKVSCPIPKEKTRPNTQDSVDLFLNLYGNEFKKVSKIAVLSHQPKILRQKLLLESIIKNKDFTFLGSDYYSYKNNKKIPVASILLDELARTIYQLNKNSHEL